MRNVYLVLILCCLVSCNHKTEEGKSLMVTHESIQLKNDYLGKPGPIIELDKKIVGIDYALDSCLFYIDSETRPISDGFKKNNVNYWVFRDLCSIILHS